MSEHAGIVLGLAFFAYVSFKHWVDRKYRGTDD